MFIVQVPAPPPPVKLTIVVCGGQVRLVEVPYPNGRPRAKRGALLALFNLNPTHCVRANF